MDTNYTAAGQAEFRLMLLDLLRNDLEVANIICKRCRDVLDARGIHREIEGRKAYSNTECKRCRDVVDGRGIHNNPAPEWGGWKEIRMIQTVRFDYAIGDEVIVKPINLTGRIDGLRTDNRGRMYRVVYWNDGTRYNPWLYPWEIEGRKSHTDTVGFGRTETNTSPDALPQTPQKFGYGPTTRVGAVTQEKGHDADDDF